MRIAIISDTHENEPAIKKAVKKIQELNVDIVIHCGDLISPPTLSLFKDLKDFRMVFGNNDGEHDGLKTRCSEYGFEEPEFTKDFEINGKKFFIGHEPEKVMEAINLGKYDYVLHGHTHVQKDELIGKTRVINPGALFMVQYYTFAILDLEINKLEFHGV